MKNNEIRSYFLMGLICASIALLVGLFQLIMGHYFSGLFCVLINGFSIHISIKGLMGKTISFDNVYSTLNWIRYIFSRKKFKTAAEAKKRGLNFWRNVYGDEINQRNCRSLWVDKYGFIYNCDELYLKSIN